MVPAARPQDPGAGACTHFRAGLVLQRGERRACCYGCVRDGGHSGWLSDNIDKAKDYWDPEARIKDLWSVVGY